MNGSGGTNSSSSPVSGKGKGKGKGKVNGKQTRLSTSNSKVLIQEQDPDFEKEMSEDAMLVDGEDEDELDSQADSSSSDDSSDEESSDADSSDEESSDSTSGSSTRDPGSITSSREGPRANANAGGGLDFAHLERLAASAAESMRARAEAKKLASRKGFEEGDDVIAFGSERQQHSASKSQKRSAGTGRLTQEKGKGRAVSTSKSSGSAEKDARQKGIDRSLDQLSTGQVVAADAPKTGRGAKRDRQMVSIHLNL